MNRIFKMIKQKVITKNGTQKVINVFYDPNPKSSEISHSERFSKLKPMEFIKAKKVDWDNAKPEERFEITSGHKKVHKDNSFNTFWPKGLLSKDISKKLENIQKPVIVKREPSVIQYDESNFLCEAAGYEISCSGNKCTAHIITQQYEAIRASVNNRIRLCKEHEKYFNVREQKEWFQFVKNKFPDKFKWVKSRYHFILDEYERFIDVAEEI